MARATKCDRCGGYGDRTNYELTDPNFAGSHYHVDVCESCWLDYIKWFRRVALG